MDGIGVNRLRSNIIKLEVLVCLFVCVCVYIYNAAIFE